MRYPQIIKLKILVMSFLVILLHASYSHSSDCVASATGNTVVFFQLDRKEYRKLNELNRSEVDEALYDFQRYAQSVKSRFKAAKIKVLFTSCNTILVDTIGGKIKYYRKDLDECCGVILVKNGKEPKVMAGVSTDEEILDDARQYFSTSIP